MTARSDSALRDRLSCTATLRYFGVWRAMVATVGSAAQGALLAWIWFWPEPLQPAAWGGTALTAVAIVAMARSLATVQPGVLRCRHGGWTFAPTGSPEIEPQSGDLSVALDLGTFMLLAFSPTGRTGLRSNRRWLPAQKRGLESDWHALRTAVHAPRSQRSDAPYAEPSRE